MSVEHNQSVGQRVARTRKERGLSIEELAKRAGCSEEYLEWVEEGQAEPPVALLLRLGRAMKLGPGAFLKSPDSSTDRLEEASKRTAHYSYKTLTPAEADKHLMAFSVLIPPGTAHEGVGYKHEGEEFVFVISGEVELAVDSRSLRLAAKESFRFDSSLNHHLSNPGRQEAELLVVLYLP
jgi:transcriptional regulator with XRE-family HTH domain